MLVVRKQVFMNAEIYTMCDKLPKAQAVCVSNGRIEAVGTNDEIKSLVANTEHEVIDCQGKFLYPGFIDTHSHLSMYSNLINHVFCGVPSKSIADVLALLKEKAKKTPKGEWIVGYSFDDSALIDKRHLNCHDLDSVSTEHPIFICHITSHMGYLNSNAIKQIGITKESTIAGGEYFKDENGEPNGFLIEYAYFESLKALPIPSIDEMKTNLKTAITEYNKYGFTTILDGGVGFGGSLESFLQVYTALDNQKELTARPYMQFLEVGMEKVKNLGLADFSSDYLKFGGLKYFSDGSIQIFTAALLEDYHTKKGHKGELLVKQEEIDAIVEKYHSINVQIAIHANGDAACEACISAFEKAFAKNPRTDLNHMLVHAQMASDNHLARMKKIGIIPTFFARHIEVWADRHAELFIGKERVSRLDPTGSAARLDMPFALHVDTPVLPVTALGSMHAAVNRISSAGVLYGEDQRISPLKALEAYTKDAALCCNSKVSAQNVDRGIIDVGLYADFVLLEKDLLSVDPLEIKDIKILKTICGGKTVYSDK